MKNYFLFPVAMALLVFSCTKQEEKAPSVTATKTASPVLPKETEFTRLKADTATDLNIPGFYPVAAYRLGENFVVSGHPDLPELKEADGTGAQLLVLDAQQKILYKGPENTELFQYDPVFFKGTDGRTVILVQKAFEYFCGADAFVLQGNRVQHLGTLDVEPSNPELRLVDKVQILPQGSEYIFRIQSDSLVLNPGGEDKIVANPSLVIRTKNGKIQNLK